ncbi:MAG: hypothetical protein JWM75_565 [Sphingomonas bacterium]|nr:hypothetical protein [Sphingomonas bacterium]
MTMLPRSITLLAGAALMLLWAAAPSGASAAAIATKAAAHPDFTGSWDRYPREEDIPDKRFVAPPIPDPPLREPYLGQWQQNQAKLAARLKESQPAGDSYVKCLPDGMPAMMQAMFPIEFLQRPEQINITEEAFNQARRVYMNEKLPAWDQVDPSFYGRSVGRWEGDTLVIETVGIKQSVLFRWAPHSEQMKITERIRLLSPDFLQNEVRIEDPYLAKPWTYSYTYKRLPNYKIQEYVCEDNRDFVDEAGNHRLRVED